MIPTMVQLNHDLNFLYTIARTQLPKEVLEAFMYGSDFDEPTEEDYESVYNLIEANKDRLNHWLLQGENKDGNHNK